MITRLMMGWTIAAATTAGSAGHEAGPWVDYVGGGGPGAGRSIVLVSGDEEYRSEEALPMLGRILSVRHGFDCRVVFAINPETGAIDPDYRQNIPGLEALSDADLMIIATRFRDLPDEQMAYIDEYVRSGRPIIGLRTATHAFNIESSPTYRHYTWNYDGDDFTQGFGRQVLGETWIAHHGQHGAESTRGIVAPGATRHAIVRGITTDSIWGPTDVYRVRLPLPDDCTPIVLGQVLAGMNPRDVPVVGPKNEPLMPIGWTKTHDGSGFGPRRAFTTTMGAATDFEAEGTRRMLVNAVYWTLELDDRLPADGADVRLVGPYAPTAYGFGAAKQGVLPDAHRAKPPRADRAKEPPVGRTPNDLVLTPDTRILVAGNTFAERMAQSGWFDAFAHAAHPDHRLVIRHIPWSADEVALRPREHSVPTMLQWVTRLDPDVLVLCFGMSESFTMTPAEFETDLRVLVERLETARADGTGPRLVLVSPIEHEGRGIGVRTHNEQLVAITEAMGRVAGERSLAFVDLLGYPGLKDGAPATTNGVHPREDACGVLAAQIATSLGWMDATAAADVDAATAARVDTLRTRVADQHWLFRLRYRPTNTEYVWGRRHKPFGIVNFPPEMDQLDRMIAVRDRAVWAFDLPAPAELVARAGSAPDVWPTTPSDHVLPEDDWSPAPVEAKGTETSLGDVNVDLPDDFAASFTLPDDYVIECFASEQDFPELANPLAMTFDDRGRLWVLCTPTYPHLLPGEHPRCQLIILEDSDRDGRADDVTVFAGGLYIPTGFAIDGDTVYVAEAPDLLRLTDQDGDSRADRREIIFSGFGMCDSHHQLSAFEWDPTGAVIMHEGVFTKSNVETPHGTRRTTGAGVWRYDPARGRLDVVSHCNFSNPWGHVFDDFGASILADASGGDNHAFTYVSVPYTYPHKPKRPNRFLNRGRPTAGCEIISSRHFPDDVQGSFLVNQSIGFHGTRWDRLTLDGSSWTAESMPKDLIDCSDVNFRPVAIETGPDGAIYVLDWCNPIVGHMQYSVRDPRRDHAHGRVWRVRHRTRRLVDPPAIHGASTPELLEFLRWPERNTRQHARRQLQRSPWSEVGPALVTWRNMLDPRDHEYARLLLEDLWIRQAHERAGAEAIGRVMDLDDARARGGAMRVLRHQVVAGEIDVRSASALLERGVEDPDMHVRIEAVVTCGFLPPAEGARIAAQADLHEMDEAMRIVFDEVLAHLGRDGSVESDLLERVRLSRLPADELMAAPLDDVSARVRVARADLPRAVRLEALEHLGGEWDVSQAAELVELINSSYGDDTLRGLGELLLSLDGSARKVARSSVGRWCTDAQSVRSAIGWAIVLREGATGADPRKVVPALALLEPGQVPSSVIAELRIDVEAGDADPMPAIEQIVRHSPDDETLQAWLAQLAETSAGRSLDRWNATHEQAMAAIRALAALPPRPEDARYHVPAATPEILARGEALYHDEALGCARCHGADGRGLEGYPPLDRSPWAVGDPRRTASIVVHGLFGPIEMPDGRSFNAVMEPLGAVLDDAQIAAILTYVRQSWGNYASPVTPAMITEGRAVDPGYNGPWEATVLRNQMPLRNDVLVAQRIETTNWFAEAGRQFLVYLVPPFVFLAVIILWLERRA